MGHESDHLVHSAAHVYKHVELFGHGPKATELSDIIKQHALAATGAAFIPLPVLDLAVMAANTWTMYVRINNAVGISFGDNALKSIASGIFGNLATIIPGVILARVGGSLLKLIPGAGTVGGIAVAAVTNVAILYVAGRVYLKSLEVLLHSGKPLTEENLKQAA